MEYNRAQLKRQAKADLRNAQPRAWLVTLVFFLLTSGVTLLVSLLTFPLVDQVEWVTYGISLIPEDPYLGYEIISAVGSFGGSTALSLFLSILMTLYGYVMSFGYTVYTLSLARRQETGFHALFHGFSMVARVALLYLFITIFTALWWVAIFVVTALVSALLSLVLVAFNPALAIISSTLTVLCALACGLYIILGYQMAPFLLLDDPKLSPLSAIKASRSLMKGQRMAMVGLIFSFLGWFLLVGLVGLVVFVVGFAVTLFLTGISLLAFFPVAAGPLTQFVWGLMLTSLVATLATVPLDLWITPYFHCSVARFYDVIKGQSEPTQEAPFTL